MSRTLGLSLLFVVVTALPAGAAPNPSPVAPPHVGTACVNVLTHNPQTFEEPNQALPAQMHFLAVGQAFCGI